MGVINFTPTKKILDIYKFYYYIYIHKVTIKRSSLFTKISILTQENKNFTYGTIKKDI